jgi:hypothetical protein
MRATYDLEVWSKAAMYRVMHWVRQRSSDEPSEVDGRVTHLAKHCARVLVRGHGE